MCVSYTLVYSILYTVCLLVKLQYTATSKYKAVQFPVTHSFVDRIMEATFTFFENKEYLKTLLENHHYIIDRQLVISV